MRTNFLRLGTIFVVLIFGGLTAYPSVDPYKDCQIGWCKNEIHGWFYWLDGTFKEGMWIWDLDIKTYFYTSEDLFPFYYYLTSKDSGMAKYGKLRSSNTGTRWYIVDKRIWIPTLLLNSVTNPMPGYAFIPPGVFDMGSPSTETGREADEVRHRVKLTRAFFLKQKLVTKEEWDEVRLAGGFPEYDDLPQGRPGHIPANSHNHPVTFVSWYDVLKWLNKKSQIEELTPCYEVNGEYYTTGQELPVCNLNANGYRLPTEAEWEFACRAGTDSAFYNGHMTFEFNYDPNLELIARYNGNADSKTWIPGGLAPNNWGLYDMLGNVKEHCWDHYGIYKTVSYSGVVINPTLTHHDAGERTVMRGGGYTNHPRDCRCAERVSTWRWTRGGSAGFRPARTLVLEPRKYP